MGFSFDARGRSFRDEAAQHTINALAERTGEIQMSDTNKLVDSAMLSSDSRRAAAAQRFRAWQLAGGLLDRATAALAEAEARAASRRDALNVAVTNGKANLVSAQSRLAEAESRLATESAEYEVALADLKAKVETAKAAELKAEAAL